MLKFEKTDRDVDQENSAEAAPADSHTHTHGEGHDHAHAQVKPPETMVEQLVVNREHYLATSHLMAHVQDATYIETPEFMGFQFKDDQGHQHSGIGVPNIFGASTETPIIGTKDYPLLTGRLTKFMVIELVVAIVIFILFRWLAVKIQSGGKPTGRLWNALESVICFIRDEVVRPSIGRKDSDRFLPFLLTLFFFVLGLNLMGMIPGVGSATGAIAVTAMLALCTFVVVVGSGIQKMGFVGFLKAQVPTMELPGWLSAFLVPLIFVIEIFGLLVKHFVLAVRLFANMLAGHLVLAIFVAFIGVVAGTLLFWVVMPVAIAGSIAFNMLELFVAFLQAYIFVFLASLFIGSAQHAH